MTNELTRGEKLAIQFRPFVSPGPVTEKDVDEFVAVMGKAIDAELNRDSTKDRAKQLLSALDYDQLTDFQAKCALLLERALRE